MKQKKLARLRRARQTRLKIGELKVNRLTVHRSNSHIYAQVIDASGGRVLAAASALVGKRIAEKAREKGNEAVAFDRSGYKYHGRVKALADAAREAGLKF